MKKIVISASFLAIVLVASLVHSQGKQQDFRFLSRDGGTVRSCCVDASDDTPVRPPRR